jgi:hypothetical protein
VLKGAPGHVDEAVLGGDGTRPAAVGTGLVVARELGLSRRGLLQGAGRQSAGRGLSDLLHLGQIDLEAGSLVPEGAADDDFAPLLGDDGDTIQILGSQLPRTHDKIILKVRAGRRNELPHGYPRAGPL